MCIVIYSKQTLKRGDIWKIDQKKYASCQVHSKTQDKVRKWTNILGVDKEILWIFNKTDKL